MSRALLMAALVLGLAFQPLVQAQEPSLAIYQNGRVFDASLGNPAAAGIPGVRISVLGASPAAPSGVSGPTGIYHVAVANPGASTTLQFEHPLYRAADVTVTVVPPIDNEGVDVGLERLTGPLTIQALENGAGLAGVSIQAKSDVAGDGGTCTTGSDGKCPPMTLRWDGYELIATAPGKTFLPARAIVAPGQDTPGVVLSVGALPNACTAAPVPPPVVCEPLTCPPQAPAEACALVQCLAGAPGTTPTSCIPGVPPCAAPLPCDVLQCVQGGEPGGCAGQPPCNLPGTPDCVPSPGACGNGTALEVCGAPPAPRLEAAHVRVRYATSGGWLEPGPVGRWLVLPPTVGAPEVAEADVDSLDLAGTGAAEGTWIVAYQPTDMGAPFHGYQFVLTFLDGSVCESRVVQQPPVNLGSVPWASVWRVHAHLRCEASILPVPPAVSMSPPGTSSLDIINAAALLRGRHFLPAVPGGV